MNSFINITIIIIFAHIFLVFIILLLFKDIIPLISYSLALDKISLSLDVSYSTFVHAKSKMFAFRISRPDPVVTVFVRRTSASVI